MTAKEYLRQIRSCDRTITNKLEEVTKLNELMLNVTSAWKSDVVQSGGSGDKLGDTVAKIIDLQKEINEEIDRLVDLRREVMATIDKVEESDLRDILYRRYLRFESWEEIAVGTAYTYRHVLRLHGIALKKVSEIMKDVTECH